MHKGRLSFAEDAKLAADFEEQRLLLAERAASGASAGPPSYHFICDCFFLTAKGLHLGLVKLLSDWRMLLMARASLAEVLHVVQAIVAWTPQSASHVHRPL